MNMIDTHPELLIQTADLDRTVNTVELVQEDTLYAMMRKGTSQLYNAGFDHENLVVIPTYNKAEWLTALVRHLLQQGPLDILIVDDRSLDGTGEIAEQLALLFPGRVDIMHQPERVGADAAYTAALRYALKRGYTMIFSLERDCSQQPFPAPSLRWVLNETGVVLSADVERPTRSRSFWRHLFSWGKKHLYQSNKKMKGIHHDSENNNKRNLSDHQKLDGDGASEDTPA
jgi:glycosyltransferase involved in cell wall biosynthesis